MDETEKRLVACFSAVFPELAVEEISHVSAASVGSWDSVATVTLLSVVEEEFGIGIDIEDPAQFDSFQKFVNYLKGAGKDKQTMEDPA
jgi:acyl carrier protein